MAAYKRTSIDVFRQGRRIKRLVHKALDGIALQAANESNKAKEFLRGWYQSPTTKSIFQSNALQVLSKFNVDNGYLDILDEINNSSYILDLNTDDSETTTGLSYGKGQPVDIFPNSKGFDWTALVHEYTHNLSPLGYQNPSVQYILLLGLNGITPEYKGSTYMDQEGEIYSRLMEFRQDANMLPDKRDYQYDEEFVNTYLDLLKKHKLDRYGKNITRLLNEIAYIPNNTEYNIT